MALVIKYLSANGQPLLVIDVDSDQNLADMLGMEPLL